MTWKMATITTKHERDGIPVMLTRDGAVFGESGLGYYVSEGALGDDIYIPVHVTSGYGVIPKECMSHAFLSVEICREFVEALVPLADWTQDAKSMFKHEGYDVLMQNVKRIYHEYDAKDGI